MRDYIEIGSSPAGEDCIQVSRDTDYLPAMRKECQRFLELIRKTLGPEQGTARLYVKSNPHDFGSYLEVTCSYDDQDEEGMKYAFRCEREAPEFWPKDEVPEPADK
jgi:hypothetical protein